jgi:tetraacyldisaccharide 4'-kinase
LQTHNTLRLLLLPFSWIYGGILALRNWFFDNGLNKSFRFDYPVISVGNLSTGGTGKTPHIEFLAKLLKDKYAVGVVSRGYGRKTKGFFVVNETSTAAEVGDEPLQIKLNHPQIQVAVGEQRILAIPSLLNEAPETQVVLLDDAYQHRYVNPGLNILLSDYSRMFYDDFVLPAGNLREFRKGYRRADVILVTKCPPNISNQQKQQIISRIKPRKHQQVFFTWLNYGTPYKMGNSTEILKEMTHKSVLFFGGIANTKPVELYLAANTASYEVKALADHYNYTLEALKEIETTYTAWGKTNKVLLTTQKDAVKLMQGELKDIAEKLPLYVLPIEIGMNDSEKQQFASVVETYIQKELSIN